MTTAIFLTAFLVGLAGICSAVPKETRTLLLILALVLCVIFVQVVSLTK